MMEEMAKRFGLSRHQLQMLQEAGVFTQEDEPFALVEDGISDFEFLP